VPGAGALIRGLAQRVCAKYTSDNFRSASAYYDRTGWRRPSYAHPRRLLIDAPDGPESRKLRRIVEEHRAWTRVEDIVDSSIRRIDCQVAESHAFVGNGLINHNTIIIATLPKLLSLRAGDVTLVVAHRDELIEQVRQTWQQIGVRLDVRHYQPALDNLRRYCERFGLDFHSKAINPAAD